MSFPRTSALQSGMVARLLVGLQVVAYLFESRNPFHTSNQTIDFALQYWATQRHVPIFHGNLDSARVGYYAAKFRAYAIDEDGIIRLLRSKF